MKAYVISYFSNKPETQLIRQAYHYQQICCLLQQSGIEEIIVLAQDYNNKIKKGSVTYPNDYLFLDHPKIKYIIKDDPIKPGPARNILIKEFNKTKDYWALFLDNDAIIDPRWHGKDIVNIIERNAYELAKIASVLTPISPRHQPFTAYLEKNEKLLTTHLPLQKLNYIKTTLMFLRNETMIGKEPLYFDEELPCLEDFEYIGKQIKNGGSIYNLTSVIMNDLGLSESHSTLFDLKENNTSNRTDYFDSIKEQVYMRYLPYGLIKTSNDHLIWDKMYKTTLPKNYYVPLEGGKIDTHIINKHFYNLFDITQDK